MQVCGYMKSIRRATCAGTRCTQMMLVASTAVWPSSSCYSSRLLQILLFMCLCGIIASLCGGRASEGVFVGAFLSMLSTAVIYKFLMEKSSTNALLGQVTVDTQILQ